MLIKKILALGLMVVMLGIMGVVSPGFALPAEEDFPLFDGISDIRVGTITISPSRAHYATTIHVGSQNGARYYELMAYNPAAMPATMTWGMVRTTPSGYLCFDDTFDSVTLAWIRSYGFSGAIYSVRKI